MNGSDVVFTQNESNAQLLENNGPCLLSSHHHSNNLSCDSSTPGKYNFNKTTSKCSRIRGENLLILLTVLGVVIGTCTGIGVKQLDPSDEVKMLVSFPGEMFMRLLKMLIVPIITTSIVVGLSNLDVRSSGRMGFHAISYYVCTTVSAVVLGIVLVVIIKPGNPNFPRSEISSYQISQRTVSTLDTFMDLIRNLFPDNMIAACVEVVRTSTKRVEYEKIIIDNNTNGTEVNQTNTFYKTERTREYLHSTNVLGIITFSLFFGIILSKLEEDGKPVAKMFTIFNEIFMQMMKIVIWYSPIGIGSIIAGNLLQLNRMMDIIEILGLYMITVILGLLIHGIIVLPLTYVIITRKNPFAMYSAVVQAFLIAAGTATTASALPITMGSLEKKMNIDKRVTRFVIPLGSTMNMDGTALLEGVAAVTIAQMYGMQLSLGNMITISITATMASIGAAAIPSSGLVMLVLVLTAIGLPAEAVGILWSIDWILDRLRTGVNLLGDCIGAGIVQHLNQKMLNKPMKLTPESSQGDFDEIESRKTKTTDRTLVHDSGLAMEIIKE